VIFNIDSTHLRSPSIFLQEMPRIGQELTSSQRLSESAEQSTSLLAEAPQQLFTVPSGRRLYDYGDRIELLPMIFYMYPNPMRIRQWSVIERNESAQGPNIWRVHLESVEDPTHRFYCKETALYIFDALCQKFKNDRAEQRLAKRKRNREEAVQRKKDKEYHRPFEDEDDDYTLSHELYL
jgi:hypothetical protein